MSLEAALAKGRCLCISSGGETAFSLLASGAETVVTVDINPAQNYLVELKLAAITRLPYEDLVAAVTTDAKPAYEKLRGELEVPAQQFFDRRTEALGSGLLNIGRGDRAIRLMARLLETFLVSPATVDKLLTSQSVDEQKQLFQSCWNTVRWRISTEIAFHPRLLRLLFGQIVSAAIPPDFGKCLRSDIAAVLTAEGISENTYAWQALRQRFPTGAVPMWLTACAVATVKGKAAALQILTLDVRRALRESGPFDFVALSNVVDLEPKLNRSDLTRALRESIRPGGLVVSRSLFGTIHSLLPELGVDWRSVARPNIADRSFFCRASEILERT